MFLDSLLFPFFSLNNIMLIFKIKLKFYVEIFIYLCKYLQMYKTLILENEILIISNFICEYGFSIYGFIF
jgi:hypothetical protein